MNLVGLLFNKNFLYIISVVVVLGSLIGFYYSFHVKPIKNLEARIVVLEKALQKTKKDCEIEKSKIIRQLSIVGVELNNCESKLKSNALDGFIEGVQKDDQDIDVNLNNLHT